MINDNPLISIIVPVYKVEKYLDTCVSSIVAQTYKNLEIILVDDGSPDDSPAICDRWAKKDPRIVVIHKENGGAASARNAGLDIAKGEYIGFVDSDDYISKDMYMVLINALIAADKKLACCYSVSVPDTDDIRELPVSEEPKVKVLSVEETLDAVFTYKIGTSAWRRLFHRSLFDEIRFPIGEINEDYSPIVPQAVLADGIVLVEEKLYCYRSRAGSVTSGSLYVAKNIGTVLKNLTLMEEQLASNNLACQGSYRFFAASGAYRMALVMEKHIKKLDGDAKKVLSGYIKLMWKNCLQYVFSKYSSAKDKVLYVAILTRTLKPLRALISKIKK